MMRSGRIDQGDEEIVEDVMIGDVVREDLR